MSRKVILLRYGEIFLKGKNRSFFEQKLIKNITKLSGQKVTKLRNRLVLDYFDNHLILQRVFGLISYSIAEMVEADEEKIKVKCVEILKDRKGTFKVETQRSDKRFPIKSPDFNVLIGKYIEANSKLKFDFVNPEVILNIEINEEGAFLFTESAECFGGLPVGVEGQVGVLMEGKESLLAGLLMMKRGCDLDCYGFKAYEINTLQKFSPNNISFKIVKELNAIPNPVLVVGDRIEKSKKYAFKGVIFKPLIGMDEKEIDKKLKDFEKV